MALSATLVDVSNGIGTWAFTLRFTDGVSVKYDKTFTTDILDDATVKNAAINEVARLLAVAQSAGKLTIQVGSQIDLTPP